MPEQVEPERRRSSDHAIDNMRRENDFRFETINQKFASQDASVQAALSAAKEAVAIANIANEKRFDALSTKLDDVSKYMDRLAGKSAGVSTTVGYMVAAATLVISVVVFLVAGGSK